MDALRILTVGIALVATSVPLGAAADEPPATLTVMGRATVSRMPDMATVNVALVTNDDRATRALAENNRRYAALAAKVASLGIAASNITSASLESAFNPRPAKQTSEIAGQLYGFIVTRNVAITVDALAQTGPTVDAATAAGVTQISGVGYGFRDRSSIERTALAAAVADAYLQAQAIAGAAHVQIVRILHIGDDAPPERIVPFAMNALRATAPTEPTILPPSTLDVTSSVSITYAIR